ncbi:MAG TPA: hypothetical protein VK179_18135 [Bacteroidales bacterium]|nr:hypothetical protein [Bacteroidales bacterium]
MKKLSLILILGFILAIYGNAQDLIVTTEGDSLNCKITGLKPGFICFALVHKGQVRNTILPFNRVKYYQDKYYATSEIDKIIRQNGYTHFRLAVNGGWSYRIARNPEDLPAEFTPYLNELKSGYHYGVDATYYWSETMGIGFKYYNYRSKNEMNIAIKDDISINFIGVTLGSRLFDARKRSCMIMNAAIGYMGYLNNAVAYQYLKIKGSTMGIGYDIGYDFGVSKNVDIGIQLSAFVGSIQKFKVDNGNYIETIKLEEGNYESLLRVDLSAGLRIML